VGENYLAVNYNLIDLQQRTVKSVPTNVDGVLGLLSLNG